MEYDKVTHTINRNDYDAIVSIGNKCPTTDTLRSLQLYNESFPFDYVPTTPQLILKYLKDRHDFFPVRHCERNEDDVWFGHFDINDHYDETITTFHRRFDRLIKLLENKKKVLFVYTSEADVYNEMGNRYHDNYNELCLIREYVKTNYHDRFTILAIHTNKVYANTPHIVNYTIRVEETYLSDDMSTHIHEVVTLYRDTLKRLIRDIFNI
jgi:hypothetical protein